MSTAVPCKVSSTSAANTTNSTWSKLLEKDAEWRKDELLDVLFWLRIIMAPLFGFHIGVVGLTGTPAMLGYIGLSSLVIIAYVRYLEVDDDHFGGLAEMLKENFMPSFALFLLVWIITYSATYY